MKLVVGLGNPGKKYQATPHNIGFEALDLLSGRKGKKFHRAFGLRAWGVTWQKEPFTVRLLKPATFMNRSGEAVQRALKRWNLSPEEILLVYDDLELPLGRLRIRKKGSAGGHNGVTSVIRGLDGVEAFPRLRIGVGPRPPGEDLVRYVLSPWPEESMVAVREVQNRAADAVEHILLGELDAAMNQFN
ncbi:MAG: aminoacyl-tRNA hydrolase [Kiritimatiellae bacterium]|nr:aminoacyl-tRNA hydrolase [Kiritimatiellia bacterium]